MSYSFKLAAVGGTFDHFHKGHKALLKKAFTVSQRVIVGVASDKIVRSKVLGSNILNWSKRKKEVLGFLKKKNWQGKAKIVKLNDPLGPLRNNLEVEALIISPQTPQQALNKLPRRLRIIRCPMVKSTDGTYLSSTRIRLGEINRKGFVYGEIKKTLYLPKKLRAKLRQPLGEVKEQPLRKGLFLISVGDISTKLFNEKKIKIDLAIVDFKVRRRKVFFKLSQLGFSKEIEYFKDGRLLSIIKNKAGTLTPQLFKAIKLSLNKSLEDEKPRIIKVEGEEDLAVIPSVLLSPLDSLVVYGQPDQGIVPVLVTEEKKQEFQEILSQFSLRKTGESKKSRRTPPKKPALKAEAPKATNS